jgi:hypothetical protein
MQLFSLLTQAPKARHKRDSLPENQNTLYLQVQTSHQRQLKVDHSSHYKKCNKKERNLQEKMMNAPVGERALFQRKNPVPTTICLLSNLLLLKLQAELSLHIVVAYNLKLEVWMTKLFSQCKHSFSCPTHTPNPNVSISVTAVKCASIGTPVQADAIWHLQDDTGRKDMCFSQGYHCRHTEFFRMHMVTHNQSLTCSQEEQGSETKHMVVHEGGD